MAGVFPGAETVEKFWNTLCEDKESIHLSEKHVGVFAGCGAVVSHFMLTWEQSHPNIQKASLGSGLGCVLLKPLNEALKENKIVVN